jgi:UDP-glucose 4-epimerase
MASSVVLVTGGSGFIGSHVVDRLAAAGYRPRILDTRRSPWHDHERVETVIGDIRRVEDLVGALRGCDAVCHLAAAADVGEVQAHPAWATELNAMGTLNVLEAARQVGVKRVVYASTVWVYSDVDAETVDEDTRLAPPAHLYTAGKLSGELYCNSYAELYGLQTTVLRFGIPYGPRARPAAVIPSFVDKALRGEPLTIAGSGDQQRSFVYVEDLAEGVVRGLAPHAVGRTYNLGGRETTTVRELAEIVRDEVAATEIVHTEGRSGDLRGAVVHSDRAEQELGWVASTPLREGVKRYAAWVNEQEQPVSAPGPLDRRPPAGVRVNARRLAHVATEPTYVGAAAFIAVASAMMAVVLGTEDRNQAAAFVTLGLSLLLPLWALIATPWSADRARTHTASIAAFGLASVVALGWISAGDVLRLDRAHVVEILLVSACVTSGLRVVPRRLADSST